MSASSPGGDTAVVCVASPAIADADKIRVTFPPLTFALFARLRGNGDGDPIASSCKSREQSDDGGTVYSHVLRQHSHPDVRPPALVVRPHHECCQPPSLHVGCGALRVSEETDSVERPEGGIHAGSLRLRSRFAPASCDSSQLR